MPVDVIAPAIDVAKTVDSDTVHPGDLVTYTITVTNDGDCDLTGVTLAEKPGVTFTDYTGPFNLAEGETKTFHATANPTADFTNEVVAEGADELGRKVSDTASVPVDVIAPAIDVAKTVDSDTVHPGDLVTYTITVTNDGDCDLTGVTLAEKPGVTFTDYTGPFSLAKGETATFHATANPTADFTNEVVAEGADELGRKVSDTASVPVDVIAPAIDVAKTVDSDTVHPGDLVTYTITVTNDGDCDLTGVTLAEKPGVTFTDYTGPFNLAEGETKTFHATANPTADFTNEVVAEGADELGRKVSDTASVPVDVIGWKISGTKWEDLDGDGIPDENEYGLMDVTIQLWSGAALLETTTTGLDGTYGFDDIGTGSYTVTELVPANMYATSPTSIPVSITQQQGDVTGVDFLNARYCSVAGTKWNDADSDGIHDTDEVGVRGVTITLSKNGDVVATATTASDGTYLFDKLQAGTYVVTETLPSGFKNTTPVSVTVALEPGETVTGIDFLNVAVAGEVITPPEETTTTETATETAETQLPYTGLNVMPWLLAAGLLVLAGLLILLMGMALGRR